MLKRILCAAAAALLSTHALAYDPTKASRYPSPDLGRPNVDRLIINGSTGATCANPGGCDISSLSVPSRIGASLRTLANKLRDMPVTPLDQGAQCGGIVDATPAFTALSNAGIPITLPDNCVLRIGTSVSVGVPVSGRKGGILRTDSGVTMTLNAGYSGPLTQAFDVATNGGSFQFTPLTQTDIFPEWWGNPNNDWLPAFNAAATSGALHMVLQATDYQTSNTWKILTPFLRVSGTGRWPNYAGEATYIRVASASADAVQIGPDTQPAGSNSDFQKGNVIENLSVSRTMIPTSAVSGLICTGGSGINARFLLDAQIRNVFSSENPIGFRFVGTVGLKADDPRSFMSLSAVAAGSGCYTGFAVDGYSARVAAGGNASLYLNKPNASTALVGSLQQSYGVHVYGPAADTYINDFEGGTVLDGIHVTGTYGTTNAPYDNGYKAADVDIHIRNPVVDQYYRNGVMVENINEYGSVSVTNEYAAPANAATTNGGASLRVNNVFGSLTAVDGQFIHFSNRASGYTAYGIYATNSANVHTRGNKIMAASRPIALSGMTTSTFEDTIVNPPGETASLAAVQIDNTNSRLKVVPIISGGSNVFPQCIYVSGPGTTNSELNLSTIDPASCNYTKYGYNGVANPGATFGTGNIATGVLN